LDGAEFFVDAGLGEHAAVADHDDAFEAEAVADFFDLLADGGGVGGVAVEDFDGEGAAARVAKQAEDDLEFAFFAVAAVAEFGERAGGALEIAGGEVVEDE
jgi:hypothetical protein